MNPEIFKQALKEAEKELDQILTEEAAIEKRRVEIEKRAAKLTENISHLAALADDSFKAQVQRIAIDSGLTNAVLQTLHAADAPLSVSEIRDRLEEKGFTKKYQSILATLHITLDRLSKTDESMIEKLRDDRGKKVYRPNPNFSAFKLRMNADRIREALKAPVTEETFKPTGMIDDKGKPKKVIK